MLRLHLLLVIFVSALSGAAFAQSSKGWLGIDVRDVSVEEARTLNWDGPRGARLTLIRPGSPAEKAGLRAGDIILSIDGVEVETASGAMTSIEAKRPGVEIRLRVHSGNMERRVSATLTEPPKAQVADVAEVPQLMLDTGGHMGSVKGLAFTPDGKYLVSAGDDKVIRVWDWQAGKTLRTIRGQAGPGNEGKAFAMVLSPDGRWLVAAGWMDRTNSTIPCCGDIRIYEFATGRLVALLKGHTSIVNSLAFSRDGTRLVSGGGSGEAFVWDFVGRQALHQLKGHTTEVYGVGLSPDGTRVVTGSTDTTLRLWSANDGKEIAKLTGHKDKIFRMGVSPDGTVASGSDDGELRLWNSKTGRNLPIVINQGTQVGAVAFSPDGKWVVTGVSKIRADDRPYGANVWEVATGKKVLGYTKHSNVVLTATVSPDNRLVATGGGGGRDVHVWDIKTGETKHVLAGHGEAGWAAGFSADGRRIAWGNRDFGVQYAPRDAYAYSLRLPAADALLGRPENLTPEAASTYVRAVASQGGYALTHRRGGDFGYDAILDITKDGKVVASIQRGSSDGYQHRSYSFTTDGQTLVSGGGNGALIAYDLKGQRIGDFIGHEGEVWAVTPSPDGRMLISGSADQTIRLWNIKTRELIATLFRGGDGEWVMWTPQGYYAGSPGSDKIVGWQINKGKEHAADYVGADQLRAHLHRPDIVEKAIVLASAEQAVRESPGTTFKLADLLARPVPKFRILSPAGGTTLRGGRMQVKLAVETVPDPIKAVRVQVNGRQVSEITPDIGTGGFKAGEQDLDVPLSRGRNDVRITLSNSIGEKAETVTIQHEGEGDLDKRGTLYVLAVGVDRYPGLGLTCGEFGTASCDLRYSGADARKLVEAVEKRLGPSHAKVVKRVLVNGGSPKDAPTASNIIDAIDLLKNARETDTVLMFIAGHGYNDGPSYRFLATDAERSGDTFRGVTVVPWQILQDAVERAKGRRILFLDTCHSGNAYNQTLGNAAYHANIIAYTSARFDQEALEDSNLGHGLFTYAVVEGLEGKGALGANRQISTKELAEYVVKRVEQLARNLKGEQEPQYYRGRDAEDYLLISQ